MLRSRILGTIAAIVALAPGAHAQTRMLRSPSVSADQIAFAYAQNIWIVPRSGGVARRLTSFQGTTENPKLSPDGKWVAFSGTYGGNTDVYVVPSAGGMPKRLTWNTAPDVVQGWTPDGARILFASTRETNGPTPSPRFYTVALTGGPEEALPVNRAYQGRLSPDGRRLAYRMNPSWDEERRNYRGGQNRPIWIADLKTLDVETPPWTDSKDMEPAWLGDVVHFISDRDGVANVWAYDTKSKKLKQETDFSDFDVKMLDAGAGVVVFEQAGYIHELDPKTGKQHVVDITVNGDFPWMMPEWKEVSSRIATMALSPTGKRAAVEARGEIFTIPAEKGDVRDITNSSGSAERDPAWSPDGKWLSYFSDKSGEYELVIESQEGITPPRSVKLPNHKHYYTPQWSPDGKKLLYTDTDLKLWVLDVASGQAKVVGNDPWMVPARTMNPVWSPDSKWIAYVKHLNSLYKAVIVVNAESGQAKQLTDGMSDATWPAWDASGKYLWFLASTDFALKSQWLDMTNYDHEENFALYVTILKKGEPTPFAPESDEETGVPAAPAGGRGGRGGAGVAAEGGGAMAERAAAPRAPVNVDIDFDGIAERTLAVPGIAERQYTQLASGVAGTVYFLEQMPATGTAGGGRGGAGGGNTLHRYQLHDRRATSFATGVADYRVSLDGHKLLYRTAGGGGRGAGAGAPAGGANLFIVDADRQPPAAGAGRINATLRAYIDPKQEFAQIFNEGWRNQRDYLYVPNMHGADWPKMREMYGALLPSVNHRADLNYLIDMMGSEIAIGHSYVRGGDMPEVPPSTGGQLGADFTIDQGRYRITKIYDAESWNPDLRSPLGEPGLDVKVGDYVIAVNGVDLTAPDNLYRLLDGTANRQTVLTVNDKPAADGARRVTVVPVANDQGLRTRAWVEHNRHVVDSLSHGTLAYVYIPNTGQPGYTSFNRYYFAQQDRKGAIIDERYNGGGSAADYIIDVLQRDFDGYFNNVAGDRMPFTSPAAGIWGPKVMIINEMAGSGGDLMPWMFHHRKVGTLVGKRTWGGLVHTADTPTFIDGGSMIAPRGGFFRRDDKWDVENVGQAPDVDVENWPKDVAAGHDPQLERAVQEALKQLAAKPVDRATHEPASPTWGKRIKPMP
ncbi:MAG: PD40 domain-containing protein [Gemmatimonadetes bacterium]|nr:PD40 domain-containing protein [Gemmatimonadota bacterium]